MGLQCWSLMDVDIRECACPTSAASLSPASFRFALALRLCFNSIGLHRGDFNPQAAGHVRHTGSRCAPQLRRLSTAHVQGLVRRPVRRVGLNSSLTFGRSCDDHAGSRRPLVASCNRPAGRRRPLHPGPAPFGDDPMSTMIRQIMALFDEYQFQGERQAHIAGHEGERPARLLEPLLPPIVYRIVEPAEQHGHRTKKKTLEIDPIDAETVRLIFRLAREADGSSGPMEVDCCQAPQRRRHPYPRWGTLGSRRRPQRC